MCPDFVYSSGVSQHRGWKQAPVINVVAQVQFDDNLNIEQHMGEIQVALEKYGLKGTEEFVEETQVMAPNPVTIHRTLREFFDPELQHIITVARNELRYSTSNYTTFGALRARLEPGLEVLNTLFGGGLVRRVGLRYIDLLEATADLPLDEQVDPSLRGFALDGRDGVQMLVTRRLTASPQQRLVFRALRGLTAAEHLNQFAGRRPYIPRLNAPDLARIPDGLFVLDVDVFEVWDAARPQPRPALLETLAILENFHNQASDVFKRSLTPEAVRHYRGS